MKIRYTGIKEQRPTYVAYFYPSSCLYHNESGWGYQANDVTNWWLGDKMAVYRVSYED